MKFQFWIYVLLCDRVLPNSNNYVDMKIDCLLDLNLIADIFTET